MGGLREILTPGQYRAVVAYLSFWHSQGQLFTLDQAMDDIGIRADREGVISELWSCGWTYSEEGGVPSIRYEEGEYCG